MVQKELMKVIPLKKPLGKRLYTIPEAAHYLGRSSYSMRTLIWNGELPVIKNGEGGKMWIDVNDLDLWIDRNKAEYQPLPGKKKT
jgi:excisionase family DNA binding protein